MRIMIKYILPLLLILAPASLLAAPEASRTSGVAPLAVHFWADVAESTVSAQPFHNLEYSWDFGDVGSGTWGTSGKAKNTDKGPVAAHVYKTPGTYTTTLTVRDSGGVVGTPTDFTITVQDPNTVYSGTSTTCISTTTDFTGCPAGATQVPNQSDLSVLSSYTSAGSRVLLRRGSSWTINSNISFPANTGPVHIGAYGTCSTPDDLGICSNAPLVTLGSGASRFVDMIDKHDWRLTDLAFESEGGQRGSIVEGNTNIKNWLIARNRADGLGTAIGWYRYHTNSEEYHDSMAVVSNYVENSLGIGIYLGSERLMVLGNHFRATQESHTVRIWQSYKGVLNHNIITGGGRRLGNGYAALKFHGPVQSFIGTYESTGQAGFVRHPTQFSVIANNTFGTSGPWPISIGPKDAWSDERVSDIIFEKNFYAADFGGDDQDLNPVSIGVNIWGRYISARNNVINGSGLAGGSSVNSGFYGIHVGYYGGEGVAPTGNMIYNNTIYSPDNHTSNAVGIRVAGNGAVTPENTIVRNNYVSYPASGGTVLALLDTGVSTTSSNNVHTTTHGFLDPNNVTPLLRDFQLTSASTLAIAQGYTTPLLDDFNDDYRAAPYDLGAYMYGDPTCSTTPSLCTNNTDCTNAGWWWSGTECLASEPVTPPTSGAKYPAIMKVGSVPAVPRAGNYPVTLQ